MKKILFVDDDEKVRDGLKRMLFPLRHQWSAAFAASGREALDLLAREAHDVVVADMRMPGMNGAQLLAQVAERNPETVRIILSGTWSQELRMQAVMTAHQYLSKPCDADVLRATIDRAFAVRDMLLDPALRRLISRIRALPSMPAAYVDLIRALRSPGVSVEEVGRIIAKDIAMTAKVVQLVNSAFFGIGRHITNPTEAVVYLGVDSITALALSCSVFSQFKPERLIRFSIEVLQAHSAAVAAAARAIAKRQTSSKIVHDDTFVAGLLHDIGKLILASEFPEEYERAISIAANDRTSLWLAERQVFATTHCEVGAYLLCLWGLPDPVVETVAFHHSPSTAARHQFGPLTAVHAANAFSCDVTGQGSDAISLDVPYLTELDLAAQVPAWKEMVGGFFVREER